MLDQAQDIRPNESLDWERLATYLNQHIEGLEGEMSVAQFHGGHANLTYLLRFNDQEFVLRRPPFGKIAPGTHDMKREYTVLSELYRYYPAAPRAYHFTDDASIIGAPFILMERKRGVVVRKQLPASFQGLVDGEKRVATAMIKAQANLHQLDVAAIGLTHLGKPAGFLERQLKGAAKRWEIAKTDDGPLMRQTLDLLAQNIPTPQKVALIHSDIKPDNCQFQPEKPDEVTALFDWDMATLGDPLLDFANTLGFWQEPRFPAALNQAVGLVGNWPDKTFLKAQYQAQTGFDLSRIGWYESLAYLRIAIIAQQLYKRFADGASTDKRLAGFGMAAQAMIGLANTIYLETAK